MSRLILSSRVSSSSSAPAAESAIDSAAEVRPPWLECASSMMMAKRRPRCSLPISSRMNGNFCTVEMMIFLPLGDELAQVARVLGVADGRAHLRELLDGVRICWSRMLPVGDDDDRVEDRRVVLLAGR